jgi:hypothetical protein
LDCRRSDNHARSYPVAWSSIGLACSTDVPRHRLEFTLDENTFYVVYGWDGALGYWAELWAQGAKRPMARYGALDGVYRPAAPLRGLLDWLAEIRALDARGLEEALAAWASPQPVRLSRAGRAALEVLEVLKREAD